MGQTDGAPALSWQGHNNRQLLLHIHPNLRPAVTYVCKKLTAIYGLHFILH